MHRLDLSLYSHLKEFWGSGVRTHVNSKGGGLSAIGIQCVAYDLHSKSQWPLECTCWRHFAVQ